MAFSMARLARPSRRTLAVVRGDSLEAVFVLKDAATGARVPLTGFTGTAVVRQSVDHAGVITSLQVEVDQSPGGQSTTGQVTIRASWELTTLFPQVGVWALSLTDGTVRKTVLIGELSFTRDVR